MTSDKQEKTRKGMRSKSYFYKYFISFLVMLIVPMVTIALVFTHAQGLIKEQIQIASQNTLNQFFGRLDDYIERAYGICTAIASNTECNQYPAFVERKQGKTTYQIWKIGNLLRGYTGETYHDIFVYYPIDDYVISGKNGSAILDTYYDAYYNDGEHDFLQEFYSVAQCSSGKPVLCSMNGKGEDAYLCVAMNQRGTGSVKDSFTVVVVLARSYVSEVLESVNDQKQKGISMICAEDNVILTTDKEGILFELENKWEKKQIFDDKIGDKNYMIQAQESDVLDAYYIHSIPYEYFWEKLFHLYIVSGIGILVSVAIGIYMAWVETRRAYRPVEQIIHNLQQRKSIAYDAKINTEFEFIETLFDKEAREKAEMNRMIRKGAEVKRDNFIYSLFSGREKGVSGKNDIFLPNGIELCSDRFCVIVFSVECEGILEKQLQLFVLSNVYQELSDAIGKGYVISLSANRYGLLINLINELERDVVFSAIEEGKNFLEQYYEITSTFGVSSIQEGVLGIQTAYEEACLALKYRYLCGKECIIDYCQVAEREFRYLPSVEAKLLYRVSEYLFGDFSEISALSLLEEVMSDYGINEECSMETVECFKFETISVLNRVMAQGGYWSKEWKDMVMELLNQNTFEEFKVLFAELMTRLCRKQQEKAEKKDVCLQAYDYIEEHYKEEQLSLNLLGEILGIAPSYLSKLFKEKYQISIPNFISQTRINGAKLLLRSTEKSIREIAEDSGFLSSSVFVKTFKKLEGITPGVYRGFFGQDRKSFDK